jgi:hypothetical protein
MSFVRVIVDRELFAYPDLQSFRPFRRPRGAVGKVRGCFEKVNADERGIFVGNWIFS